ncbi:predicted protein [Aspergillus terreus NIH2624]|uniref:Uncharacterized protein n=1 Tax=Aspergillus terreus (strain NIH 2624 / FGSC A1156) TaxID=341663 RepID=Q0CTX7_ASPTN|nr:uncharacterized protein ATEG_02857 [Aspergillus terreus NIH2624]EAU36131.1 predicted protein [Aspergillus terreus NIH2624]
MTARCAGRALPANLAPHPYQKPPLRHQSGAWPDNLIPQCKSYKGQNQPSVWRKDSTTNTLFPPVLRTRPVGNRAPTDGLPTFSEAKSSGSNQSSPKTPSSEISENGELIIYPGEVYCRVSACTNRVQVVP